MRILQILSLREHIGSYQNAKLLTSRYLLALLIAFRAEAPRELGRVGAFAGSGCDGGDPISTEIVSQVARRVGKLCEDENLLSRMLILDSSGAAQQVWRLCQTPSNRTASEL